LMVLYHWFNYFVSVEGLDYRYIRFITPSFVFLAGFLVTNLLATRVGASASSLWLRLSLRGIKLLVFFTLLNAGVGLLLPGAGLRGTTGLVGFSSTLPATYLTGKESVAVFWVLVPISYTLLVAGILQKASAWWSFPFLAPVGVLFVAASALVLSGLQLPMIELIGSGLLGLILGYVLARRLHLLRRWWPWLAVGYPLHLAAITLLGVPYLLQLVSVCLNLWLLYCVAQWQLTIPIASRITPLLGQYTLMGYVGQIAILQLLVRGARSVDLGRAELPLSLFAALFLTIAAIAVTDVLRRRIRIVDLSYRLVFA